MDRITWYLMLHWKPRALPFAQELGKRIFALHLQGYDSYPLVRYWRATQRRIRSGDFNLTLSGKYSLQWIAQKVKKLEANYVDRPIDSASHT